MVTSKIPGPPDRRDPALSRAAALQELADEARALSARLQRAAGQVHGRRDASASRRAVLAEIDVRGPCTVPQVARRRGVTRRHVHGIVRGLVADGLVEKRPNPAAARSPLLRVTAAGRRRLRDVLVREEFLFSALPVDATVADMQGAARVLSRVRTALHGDTWDDLVRAHRARGRRR